MFKSIFKNSRFITKESEEAEHTEDKEISNNIALTPTVIAYDRLARSYINRNWKNKAELFKTVEIETINRCNGNCSFCPVNKNNDIREFKLMEQELFDSILNQLVEIDYSGYITPFSNGEPFLDKRMSSFIKKIRKRLPKCFLYIFTNGSLLTLDIFKDIIVYLDTIIINNYSDDYEFKPNIKQIYEYCKNEVNLSNKVQILIRKENQVLLNRAGQAPNKGKTLLKNITCLHPFQQLVIRSSGKVSLCCNDALGKYSLGDCNNQSLIDIWYGPEYEKIREKILEGRQNLMLCDSCDSLGGETSDIFIPGYTKTQLLVVRP